MDEQRFFACQTHRSMYPSIFNRFPVIQPVSLKVRHFSTFSPPWVRPWTIAVNVAWMERGFNAGQTNRSMYPSIFNRLRAIARYWSEITTFFYFPYIYRSRWGCSHWNSGKKFGPQKARIMGLPGSEDSLMIG